MSLPDALPLDRILTPLAVTDRIGAIDALLEALPIDDDAIRVSAREAVLAREEEITTGIGGGVAIPHARVEGVVRPLLALGIAPQGLDYEAIDGKPVHLVFLCIAGKEQSREHVALLAALCGLLNDAERRGRLGACATPAEAVAVLGTAVAPTC